MAGRPAKDYILQMSSNNSKEGLYTLNPLLNNHGLSHVEGWGDKLILTTFCNINTRTGYQVGTGLEGFEKVWGLGFRVFGVDI